MRHILGGITHNRVPVLCSQWGMEVEAHEIFEGERIEARKTDKLPGVYGWRVRADDGLLGTGNRQQEDPRSYGRGSCGGINLFWMPDVAVG